MLDALIAVKYTRRETETQSRRAGLVDLKSRTRVFVCEKGDHMEITMLKPSS